MKTAYITGITGQTGSYLAEILLNKNYKVYGLIRRSSNFSTERIEHIFNHKNLTLKYGDLSDTGSLINFITSDEPGLFFNMAAMSHVGVSFSIPEYVFDTGATGTIRLLENIKNYSKDMRFLQASSSEMFGNAPAPQNEKTKFIPRSPYAIGKISSFYSTINYREAYNLFAVNSISFNHESPRRGETFVTRKITRAATRIKLGLQDKLFLGNLGAKRDWSHAKDVANAMYLIITAEKPDDYVIASEESHSVKEFVEFVFDYLNLDWKKYVEIDKKYIRPAEVDHLQGDASKIKKELGWKPQYSFKNLVIEMIEEDIRIAEKEKGIKF